MGKRNKKKKKEKKKQKLRRLSQPDFTLENERYYLDLLDDAIKTSKFRQAAIELKNVRKCNPDADLSEKEAAIKLLRGDRFLDKGEFEEALEQFQSAGEILPQFPGVFVGIAQCYLKSDQPEAGLEWIRERFETKELPKDLSVLYLKFLLLLDKPEAGEAVVKKYPNRFWAADKHWFNGVLALKDKNFQTAERFFAKAKKSGVFLHGSRAWLTWTRAQNRDMKTFSFLDQIEPEYLRRRIERDVYTRYFPNNQRVKSLLDGKQKKIKELIEKVESGSWRRAADLLDQPLFRLPAEFKNQNEFKGHVYRLAALSALEDKRGSLAVGFAVKALRLFPDDPEIWLDFCLRFSNKPISQALPLYNRAADVLLENSRHNPEKYPKRQTEYYLAELKALKASIHTSNRETKKAKELCLSALEKAPDSFHVLSSAAFFYEMEEDLEKAVIYAEKAFNKEGGKEEEEYWWIVDMLKSAGNNKKLREFRKSFGSRFNDEIFPKEKIRRYIAFALSKKDYVFLEILEERIKSDIDEITVYKKLINLFKKLYKDNKSNFARKRKAKIDIKALKDWIQKNLAGRIDYSFARVTAIDLTLYGLTRINLRKADQKILLILEDLLSQMASGGREEGQTIFSVRDDSKSPDYKLVGQSYFLAMIFLEAGPDAIREGLEFYLRHCDYRSGGLVELQRTLSALGYAGAIEDSLKDQLERDPENPGLNLARAESLDEKLWMEKSRLRRKGLELARRLQDQNALDYRKEKEELEGVWDAYKNAPPLFSLDMPDFMDALDDIFS